MTSQTAKSTYSHLRTAKKAKEDEFYTTLTDVEKELRHYRKHFKGKVVYCNCDDPRVSNFFTTSATRRPAPSKLGVTAFQAQDRSFQ
ncbi:Adenine-specific methyltransferase EcoRI [Brevibacterium sandarakinum]|uniref:Adenine-specific methyltransferase EcoRI n=1 Tax=Brevibacterium sandarakinum TaxID=629680 RepID=A0A1H1P2H9_BRESA|nr:Adenine-specific methyltransferase EcoRI [Brevibacterium sandarakinum]